jgi:hypothetical protein
MMTNSRPISRRTVLKGFGTAIALPWLEAMAPRAGFAGGPGVKPPVRMAFLFVPNGVRMSEWTPKTVGSNFELPNTLEPLVRVKEELLILTGLTHDKARANGDGPGDHARSAAAFLTGAQAFKSAGSGIRVGISVDQVAAQRIGSQTKLPSLELSCDRGRNSGQCDSGYSCAYSHNISWRTPTTPMAQEVDPKAVFDRLFLGGPARDAAIHASRRDAYRKSVLDFALDDARRLKGRLGHADQRKLDEYLTSLREIEGRIERLPNDDREPLSTARPTGIPRDFAEYLRIMADLLVLAFQTQTTSIATFVFARDGSNKSYPQVNVSDGHHDLSHHQGDPAKHEKLRRIDRFHVEQLAYLLEKLKSVREGDATLLDNCMVVYGSGISDGNRHNHDDLPVLLAGRAGGAICTGRHIRYENETPMCNLFLSMLNIAGVSVERFGDSTGQLTKLTG